MKKRIIILPLLIAASSLCACGHSITYKMSETLYWYNEITKENVRGLEFVYFTENRSRCVDKRMISYDSNDIDYNIKFVQECPLKPTTMNVSYYDATLEVIFYLKDGNRSLSFINRIVFAESTYVIDSEYAEYPTLQNAKYTYYQ